MGRDGVNKPGFLPKKVSEAQAKDTGMAMVLVCLLIFAFTDARPFVLAALVLLIVNMARPRLFSPVAKLWLGLSLLMGALVTKVILSMVFFLVLTPVGLIRRLLGKDTLMLKQWKRSKGSVFVSREHTYVEKDIERPF